ncbi:MAG: hypothetical protein COU08_03790 [Candidatus Harrisonbacteria bacterium CG10_big_fil_rev_8_21_14_0_10_42_17]|uniref:Type 4a pilus biogenesis protein PilO n=1 Tax=Candidatus Harrisonbacteria bacterium CG10_big_fil_rev_8_21_14_0_10_42_17 TaxID=1974584 RepID=A0A2M6WHA1_9BACT|nr:MAG: hypothetical protein COU08_03790 [Candidatus Harrisonbacteria bacterium CG10_big_fil_rev_8_21_14_0_10_42_17]
MLLIGAIYVYASLVRGEYEKVNIKRGELASKKELLANQEKIIGEVRDLLVKYTETANLQETLELSLPNGQNIPTLINQMYVMPRLTGMSLESVNIAIEALRGNKIQTTTAGGATSERTINRIKIGSIELTVSANGSYEQFKRLLEILETNVRIMDVKTFSFSRPSNGEDIGFDITLNTYYQTE